MMKGMTPVKIKAVFSKLVKGNTAGMKVTPPDKLIKLGSKSNPNFKKSYMLAKRVLDNSAPEVKNKKVIEYAAIGIASRATVEVARDVGKDIVASTKDGVKRFIKTYRKNRDSQKPDMEMPAEHHASMVLGSVGLLASLSVIVYTYTKLLLPFAKDHLPGMLNHFANVTLPNARDAMMDFFSGSGSGAEAVGKLKDWNIQDAPPMEVGLFAFIAVAASIGLLAFLTAGLGGRRR